MQKATSNEQTKAEPESKGETKQQQHPIRQETGVDFLKKDLPKKEALIEGLLYRRDLGTLAGRRCHGKTSLVLNLVLLLADPYYDDDFLGYVISQPRKVLAYLLEDDAAELQDKIRTMLGGREFDLTRVAIRTKDDFYPHGLRIDVSDAAFRNHILKDVEEFKPDVVIFDNPAHFVGADYNNPKKMHEFTRFSYSVSQTGNCAVIAAAHPRKQPQDAKYKPSLAKSRDDFFDEVMGASHFVNSTGSLWGIEKTSEGYSYFLGGTQRLTGTSSLSVI